MLMPFLARSRTFRNTRAVMTHLRAIAGLALAAFTITACDRSPTSAATPLGGSLQIAFSATVAAAAPGAVMEAVASYTPAGGGAVVLARDSLAINTGGADGTLALVVDVTECVKAAAGGNCILTLTITLKRNGVVLDQSSSTYPVTATTESITVPTVQLFEVGTIRITPLPTIEPGDTAVLVASPLDSKGQPVSGRSVSWSVVSGAVTISATGVLRASTSGPATIRASIGGRTQDLSFVVAPPSVARLLVDPADTTVTVGSVFSYRVTAFSATGAVLTQTVVSSLTSSNVTAARVAVLGFTVTAAAVDPRVTITATTGSGRNGTPVSGTAILHIEAAPTIAVTPASLNFSTELGQPLPPAQTVAISNGGGGTLGTLSIAGPLDASITATLDRTTAPATLTVRPTTTLPAGTSRLSVSVPLRSTTPGVIDASVTVVITQVPPPAILLDRPVVVFDSLLSGASGGPVTVQVTTVAGRTLRGLTRSIVYTPNVTPWLTAGLAATSTNTTLTLSASAGSLPQGTYTAALTLSSTDPHTPVTLPVTMRVIGNPRVQLSPKSVNFGTLDPAVTSAAAIPVTITASGPALTGLAVTFGGATWLRATLQSTTATAATPATLSLQPLPSGLADGAYTALVIVTTATPNVGPDTVTARMDIKGQYVQVRQVGTGAGTVTVRRVSDNTTLLNCTLSPRYTFVSRPELTLCDQLAGGAMDVAVAPWPGSTFDGWDGTCPAAIGRVCTVNGASALRARFTLQNGTTTISLSGAGNGNGDVVPGAQVSGPNPCRVRAGAAACTFTVPFEQTYTVSATALADSRFVSWSSVLCNPTTNSTCTVIALGGSYQDIVRFDRLPGVLLSPKTVTMAASGTFAATANVNVLSSGEGPALTLVTPRIEYIGTATTRTWLNASLLTNTTQTTLRLTARPDSLAFGAYQARVIVGSSTAGASPDTLAVTFNVSNAQVWEGRLTTTSTFPFGGSPFCDYSAVFTNVLVRMTYVNNILTSSTWNGRYVESALNQCQFPPASANDHVFAGSGTGFLQSPNSQNLTYIVDLAQSQGFPLGFGQLRYTISPSTQNFFAQSAFFSIQRTDQQQILNWLITGTVFMTRIQ